MSKRKLSRRQKWRIEKIQEEKTQRAARQEKNLERQYQSGQLGEEQEGLVIAHYGKLIDVEALEGETKGTVHRCHFRANVESLVTGDRVIWRAGADESGVVETVKARTSLLQRPDNFGLLKPVAANIDRIVIVVAIEPIAHANLIDRYLVASETVGIKPAILFNKADLLNDENSNHFNALSSRYAELGYEVMKTSVEDETHLSHQLTDWLGEHTSIFVGQSGVGKSSIIRVLLGDDSIKVGALSENTRKGTHTTTTAKLFHLNSGGQLIDSPGIREFGLWHIDREQLEAGFIEFRPFLGYCKFRDCKHEKEPGCALLGAFEKGEISAERFESYKLIRDGLDDLETYT